MLIKKPSNKPMSLIKIIFTLMPISLAACPLYFIVNNLIGIIHGISFGVSTFATQKFFDSVTKNIGIEGGFGKIIVMLAALGGAIVASQLLNGAHNFMGETLYRRQLGYFSMKVNEKAAAIDPIAYEDPALLDHINKAREGVNNSLSLMFTVSTLFTFYIPYFLFMGIYLFSLKPLLSLSLILIFIPVTITQLIRGGIFAKLEDEAAPIRREYEYYEKCICDREYFKETRLLGAFDYFKDLYVSSMGILNKKLWKAEKRTGLMELAMKIITLFGYLGVLYLLFDALFKGEITIGAFSAVFASVGLMFSIMEEIICRHAGYMTKNLGSVRNFISFLNLPERQGRDVILNGDYGISIKGASFRYPGANFNSIDNITLDIKAGETIAIVGENGAGKTTLVKLITGLYLPTEGKVEINGVDTREVSPKSIYRGVSAVFQKYQRYKMKLSENINISDLSTENINKEEYLNTAISKADLDAKGESFPSGYDTILSREFDGVDLSGGQWQRIAIARGFYRAHNIIILDEPTAAIDPIEETRIYNNFASISKGKTSIIVTHRLGSAKIAHRILVMEGGKIVEVGSHEELMKKEGKYAEMFLAQAQWYVQLV